MTSLPSTRATLHLRFRAIWGAQQAAISRRSTFLRRQTRGDVAELLWRAGTLSTRSCQHAATVYARSCQAKNYGRHATVLTDRTPVSNIRRLSDARAENRTRHSAAEQLKTVSKIRRPAGNQTPGLRGSR